MGPFTYRRYNKNGQSDLNTLSVNNHSVSTEDAGDGSYIVSFQVQSSGFSSFPLKCQVHLNLDRDASPLTPNGVDLA